MKLRVLLNPTAGTGSAGRRLPEIRQALLAAGLQHDLAETRGPGDAARLVDEARADGVECLAVVGGDGTLNEVSQAFLDAEGRPRPGPDLALLPAGTGGDFRKTFGVGPDLAAAARRLRDATPRPIDLGVLTLTDHQGRQIRRAFINVASFGLGGLTDRIVNQSPKWLGGKVSFFLGALRAMAVYRNLPVRVLVDGEPCLEAPVLNVALANGRYFGGGMHIAPNADPSDGLLDVIALYDLTRAQGIGLAAKIYRGTHPGSPGVRVARGRVVEAAPLHSKDEVLIDMDGETPGRLPLRAELAPGALRLRA